MHISKSISMYKLLVLYMIDVIDYPLSNAQLSDFILGHGYTDYFNLQQAISDLIDTGMIEATKVIYKIYSDWRRQINSYCAGNTDSFRYTRRCQSIS